MRRLAPRIPAVATALVALPLALSLATITAAGAASSTSKSGAGSFPGASGSVAAITGSSMEVQSEQSGQVTVNWSTSTTFSETVAVAASSVAAGDCVTVTGTVAKKTKKLTAKTVTISQPTAGSCSTGGFGGAGGAGGGGGRFGGGTPPSGGTRPSGAAGGSGEAPAGGPGGGGAGRPTTSNTGFASGTVKTVTSSTLTITGISSAAFSGTAPKKGAKSSASTKKAATPKTTTVKIALASSTTYTEGQSAASSALAVGDCVTATGSDDSTGAVSATSVHITSTGGKTCTTGFGGFGGGAGA